MQDVTDVLQSYRECMRHLWNANFLGLLSTATDRWNLRDLFDDAGSALFRALVVERLALGSRVSSDQMLSPSRRPSPAPLAWLSVVPGSEHGMPIMINRDATSDSGYWDHPITRVSPGDVDLRFVGWFDFDELDFRDFKYYQVRIISSRVDGLAGRSALMECEYARVFVDEAGLAKVE
jgi:hypothetical protein